MLLAAGDIGRCDSTHDDATGALVASLPGVIATLGDTAYEDGTTAELNDCFGGSWGAVKDRIRFAVTGNHDIHTDGGAPMQAYMGERGHPGRTYLVLGRPRVRGTSSSSTGTAASSAVSAASGSDQATWLRDDLAASDAWCTVALLHQPRFSSGQHGNDRSVGPLWDALYGGGADLVLDGHDHDYERFGPQDPERHCRRRRAGSWRSSPGPAGPRSRRSRTRGANSLVRINDTYGVLELTLSADSWSSRFVGADGSTHDEASGTCH